MDNTEMLYQALKPDFASNLAEGCVYEADGFTCDCDGFEE